MFTERWRFSTYILSCSHRRRFVAVYYSFIHTTTLGTNTYRIQNKNYFKDKRYCVYTELFLFQCNTMYSFPQRCIENKSNVLCLWNGVFIMSNCNYVILERMRMKCLYLTRNPKLETIPANKTALVRPMFQGYVRMFYSCWHGRFCSSYYWWGCRHYFCLWWLIMMVV